MSRTTAAIAFVIIFSILGILLIRHDMNAWQEFQRDRGGEPARETLE